MTNLPLKKYYKYMYLPGMLLLVLPTLLRGYFMMPFPGSQEMDTMGGAYFLDRTMIFTRIIGFALVIFPILNTYFNGRLKGKIWTTVMILVVGGLFYAAENMFNAGVIFKEPSQKIFASGAANNVPMENLVVGVEVNGEAKAYPIQCIGYHHKVQDSVGGKAVLVTYCTMCRSARVFDPIIDGKYQRFRLVGARHYNAVIEDEDTKSWWHQESGVAAIGPSKGKAMAEIPSEQMTLSQWTALHPNTLVMQADPKYKETYARLEGYDRHQTTKTEASNAVDGWQRGAWVVGVAVGNNVRAYRWNDIQPKHIINDQIGAMPVLLAVGNDSLSFGCWKRTVDGNELTFSSDSSGNSFRDASGSLWNFKGLCTDGIHQGKQLERVQAYQEYWHSWKTFHPATMQWKS